MLAARKSEEKSLYRSPSPALEITPTPPSLATAEASPEREIPTPIPPCIIGTAIARLPILNVFILIFLYFFKGRLINQSQAEI